MKDLFALAGFGLLSVGLYLVSLPTCLIVTGGLLLLAGVVAHFRRHK